MKKFLYFLPILFLFLTAVFIKPTVFADTASDLQKKINDLQSKISELQGQEKTLSSQIAVMDNQISLTELKIASVEQQITDLTLDIDTTTKKISKLEGSLDNLTKVLINRIKATYIAGSASSFQILLASSDVSDFVERANYLRIAQAHDKKLIYDTVQAKNDYSNQKTIFEDKKEQVEALKAELVAYTTQLDREKAGKAALLAETKGSEAEYQRRLQIALSEQRAISAIVSGGGNAVNVGSVKEGDVIGTVIPSSSPCSTGAHLHFEIHKDGSLQDPSGYLSNKSVTWDNAPDGQFGFSGSWNWPLSDPIYIEQGYGMTSYAQRGSYNGGPHTGIDMYSPNLAVRAVKDGTLYRGSYGGCYGGGQLLFARVDQSDGAQTYYLHIN